MIPTTMKCITTATCVDFWRRHQIPDRLLALCAPLARGALLWLVASVILMAFAAPFAPHPVAVIFIVIGAATFSWSIVLASLAASFAVGHPRMVFARRGSSRRRRGSAIE